METVKKGCEGAQYVLNKAYEYREQILDGVQLALDIAGFVPILGDALDGVNGVISLARGNTLDAALSFAAMIPFAGDVATVGKLAMKAEKAFEVVKATDKAIDLAKGGEKALTLVKGGEKALDLTKTIEKGITKPDFIAAPGGIVLKAEDYITDASRMLPEGTSKVKFEVPEGGIAGDSIGIMLKWAAEALATQEQLQEFANDANQAVDGQGTVPGTLKHTEFAKQIKALDDPLLQSEVTYKDGQIVPYGTKGGVRLDAVEYNPDGTIKTIYDLKTGNAA